MHTMNTYQSQGVNYQCSICQTATRNDITEKNLWKRRSSFSKQQHFHISVIHVTNFNTFKAGHRQGNDVNKHRLS